MFNCLLRIARSAGLGAKVFTILVEGFLFVDDASLLAGTAENLRILLLLTARFGLTWRLPFCDKPKSVVLVVSPLADYSGVEWDSPPFKIPTVCTHTIVGLTLSSDL